MTILNLQITLDDDGKVLAIEKLEGENKTQLDMKWPAYEDGSTRGWQINVGKGYRTFFDEEEMDEEDQQAFNQYGQDHCQDSKEVT